MRQPFLEAWLRVEHTNFPTLPGDPPLEASEHFLVRASGDLGHGADHVTKEVLSNSKHADVVRITYLTKFVALRLNIVIQSFLKLFSEDCAL